MARVLGSLRFRTAAAFALLVVVQALATIIAGSILIAGLITAGVATLLSLLVTDTVLRPLARVTRAARAVSAGDMGARVSPRPAGELGELADAFNQMGDSLQRLIALASQERSRMLAALNSSVEAVIAVDAEGRITFANLAAQHLFFRALDELVGNPIVWVLPNDRVIEALRASREEGRRQTQIIERPNKQYLQLTTTPIVAGGDWAALAVFHDLTDVRRADQVRRDFIANVSHELRTPLASIKSVIETLQTGALHDEAAAPDFLARADLEVDRLTQMVEELMELSRIESGQVPMSRGPVDMASIVAAAAERLRPQAVRRRIDLRVEGGQPPPIDGDAERLERAVVNLIHNAIKFTPDGGSVTVRTALDGGAVTVQVADTGAGIAAEDIPRVFERFYKADRARARAGTGLGLAVVKHTIEAHGGTVSVHSREGEGSTFELSIPVAARPASRA